MTEFDKRILKNNLLKHIVLQTFLISSVNYFYTIKVIYLLILEGVDQGTNYFIFPTRYSFETNVLRDKKSYYKPILG